ncbi:MAG: hypothetical protein ACE5D1_03560, partial [Fidelibacterota bacterium]
KTVTKNIFFFVEYHLSVDYYLMNNTYQDKSKESRKSKTSDYLNINRTHRTMIELSGTKIGLSLQF